MPLGLWNLYSITELFWYDYMKFEDKLTKELLKIVHYNLQTSISLFSKDIKVEQSFSSSESLFHKLAALAALNINERCPYIV